MAIKSLYFRKDDYSKLNKYFIFDTEAELLTANLIIGDLAYSIDTKKFFIAKTSSTWVSAGSIQDTIIFSKASGNGIKVDPETPTFPWEDILGEITVRDNTLATAPHFFVYNGNIRQFQFDVNDEAWLNYHIPHDYVLGTDVYVHIHWSQNETRIVGGSQSASGTVTGGTVSYSVQAIYSKGHQQAAFGTPTSALTLQQTCSTTIRHHHIIEAQLSAASPAATQIDSDNIEPDGLLLIYVKFSANNITVSSGNPPDPFIHYVDLHYQTTGIGTKQKAPNFYT